VAKRIGSTVPQALARIGYLLVAAAIRSPIATSVQPVRWRRFLNSPLTGSHVRSRPTDDRRCDGIGRLLDCIIWACWRATSSSWRGIIVPHSLTVEMSWSSSFTSTLFTSTLFTLTPTFTL
jgi:hypothetical protein